MNHQHRYGATYEEWSMWVSLTNGGSILMPAMGSPAGNQAPRKERSAIRHLEHLHKTPSAWDGQFARGMRDWVQHVATNDQLREWASVPDYNILMQTGGPIKAIDIDISNSQFADAIERAICSALGTQLPARYRENSGNRTLLFRLDEPTPLNRRAIIVANAVKEGKTVISKQQAIELLASGQQTALAGTHPSGARFLMRDLDVMRGIPVVSLAKLAAVWDQLRKAYDPESKPLIVSEEAAYAFVARTGGTVKNDPVLTWLEANGYVKSYEHNGTANIVCPNQANHTTHGNDNATSWLPRGLGGKDRGNFRCLHAHCVGLNTGRFLDLIGYEEAAAKAAFQETTRPAPPSAIAQLRAQIEHHQDGSLNPADLSVFTAVQDGSGRPADLSVFTAVQDGSGVPADLSWFKATVAAVVTAASMNLHGADLSWFTAIPLPGTPPITVVEARRMPEVHAPNFYPPAVRQQALALAPNERYAMSAMQGVEKAKAMQMAAQALREAGENFTRDDKTGKIKKTADNLFIATMLTPHVIATRYDTFKGVADLSLHGRQFEPMSDDALNTVVRTMERGLDVSWSHDQVSRGLSEAAQNNSYDSATDAVRGLQWDGKVRVQDFASSIMKAEPSTYATALSMYTWVAMAARVLDTGVKADIAPVFISPKQGTGKSSAIRAMALEDSWYGELDFRKDDDDLARLMRGKVVLEIPEMLGVSGRDAGATKAFMTKQTDGWVPKYKEHAIEHERRCLFIGTDNKLRMLTDPTGNRRWAPLRVAVTSEFCDGPGMARERNQYWAEAADIVARFATPQDAVEHYSTILRNLAGPYIRSATVVDSWLHVVEGTLNRQAPGTKVSLQALYAAVGGGSLRYMDNLVASRIRGIMTMLNFEEVDADLWQIPNTKIVM